MDNYAGNGSIDARKRLTPETVRPLKRRRLVQYPNIKRNVDEVKRLMNRIPTTMPKKGFFNCAVCLSNDHLGPECPCLYEIPEGVTLSPIYDTVCIGCGKIGDPPCCGKGTYAIRKCCGGCRETGHWFWEMRCPKGHVFPPSIAKLPGVEYVEVISKPELGICQDVAGPVYWKSKEVKSSSSNQSRKKWKNLGSKIICGVDKIVL